MSLLSKVKSAVSKVASTAVKTFYKGADPVITAIAHPIKVAQAIVSPTKTVKDVQNEFFSQTKNQQAAQFVAGAVTLGGVAAIGKAVATQGVKAVATTVATFAKNNPKTTIAAPLVATAVYGALTTEPEKTISVASGIVPNALSAAQDFGALVVNPTVSGGIDYVQEHPIATTLGAGLALGATVKAALPAISAYETSRNTDAIRNATNSSQVLTPVSVPAASLTSASIDKVKPQEALPYSESAIPQSASNTAEPTKKRRKSKKKVPPTQNIRQTVNIYEDDDHHHRHKHIKRRRS